MSEQPPQVESADALPGSETAGTWSGNGTHPEEAAGAASDAGVDAAPIVEEPTDAPADSTGAPDDDGAAFIGELVRSMQATADAERAKVAEGTERRREARIAAIHARRESEANQMRELADEELKAIDGWAEAERQHIQLERERRAQVLHKDLETSLAEHGSKIDREIEAVEAAIATYRAEVDAYFVIFERETDPIAIAQHAGRRPVFPTLETIGEGVVAADTGAEVSPTAEPLGAAEDSVVGVMDPQSVTKVAQWWPARNVVSGSPDRTEAPANVDQADASGEIIEPVPVAAGPVAADPAAAEAAVADPAAHPAAADESNVDAVLHSMPVSRPMSWLRRDREPGEGANKDK